jgi:predicted TIM-barrel fold metal-dependent hydrolase
VGETAVVELLATEYPDVAFIIPHLGSFADDWRAQLALIDHLVRHPNVYADTSGVRRFDLLQQAVQRAGARKILFGSDGPWLHPGVELAKIRALRLPPAEERLVLGGNVLRLLAQRRHRRACSSRQVVYA